MVNGMVKGKRIPPARQRYEQSHPVVAIRVSQELYDQLQSIKTKGEKSFADILKEGLGIEKATTEKTYRRGYNKGYAEAKKLYCVRYPCKGCRQPLEITSEEEKEFARQAMIQVGWGHQRCIRH